jgi:hypothetical protein
MSRQSRFFVPILAHVQGDQIGQIFAHWANVYFGEFFIYFRSSPCFGTTFFPGSVSAVIFPNNVLGYILGDFFPNTSGHPAHVSYERKRSFVAIKER